MLRQHPFQWLPTLGCFGDLLFQGQTPFETGNYCPKPTLSHQGWRVHIENSCGAAKGHNENSRLDSGFRIFSPFLGHGHSGKALVHLDWQFRLHSVQTIQETSPISKSGSFIKGRKWHCCSFITSSMPLSPLLLLPFLLPLLLSSSTTWPSTGSTFLSPLTTSLSPKPSSLVPASLVLFISTATSRHLLVFFTAGVNPVLPLEKGTFSDKFQIIICYLVVHLAGVSGSDLLCTSLRWRGILLTFSSFEQTLHSS